MESASQINSKALKVIFFIIYLIFCAAPIFAQNSKLTSNAAWELILQNKNPIVIDSLSVNRFEAVLIPSFADKIAEQELTIGVKPSILNEFKLDASWINLALRGGTRTLKNGSAIPDENSAYGPAFGGFDQLEEESDAGVKATKLLWNVVSLAESKRFIDLKIDFSWIDQKSSSKNNVIIRLVRAYPGTLKQGSAVAMREKFTILEPEWLASFAFLTLRQYGTNEDLLWYYSPALNSIREVLGSLRGDGLLESLISLDDIDVFSGKPEMLQANTLSNFKTLVPFTSATASSKLQSESAAPCQSFSNPNSQNLNPLADLFLAPRDVYALELKQRDPFSLLGRQVLYVDKITQLPFYKEVYAQDGKLIKSVLGTFSPVFLNTSSPDSAKQTHFIAHTIIAFGKSEQISILKTLDGKVCSEVPKELSKKFFDPSELDSKPTKASSNPKPSETPNAKQQKSAQAPNKTPIAH